MVLRLNPCEVLLAIVKVSSSVTQCGIGPIY